MSDKYIEDGFFVALICIVALLAMFMLGFFAGEGLVESHCTHYGKHIDNQETYICEKQK